MKTLIAVPCMDFCHTDFLRALLSLEVSGEVQYTFAQSSLIYDARNQLAKIAVEGSFDRVLWLDSDVVFPPSAFKRLHEHLDMGREFVTALIFGRRPPYGPLIYKGLRFEGATPFATPVADVYDDWPRDELFRVHGCGFGCCMTSVDLLRRVYEKHGPPFFPVSGFGEDLSFCLRAENVGAEIWCDGTLKPGHVGLMTYTEESHFAVSKMDQREEARG